MLLWNFIRPSFIHWHFVRTGAYQIVLVNRDTDKTKDATGYIQCKNRPSVSLIPDTGNYHMSQRSVEVGRSFPRQHTLLKHQHNMQRRRVGVFQCLFVCLFHYVFVFTNDNFDFKSTGILQIAVWRIAHFSCDDKIQLFLHSIVKWNSRNV